MHGMGTADGRNMVELNFIYIIRKHIGKNKRMHSLRISWLLIFFSQRSYFINCRNFVITAVMTLPVKDSFLSVWFGAPAIHYQVGLLQTQENLLFFFSFHNFYLQKKKVLINRE